MFMMSGSINKHIDVLRLLYRGSKSTSFNIISHSSNNIIKVISTIALNIIKGVVPISTNEKVALSLYRDKVKKLTLKSITFKKKRDILLSDIKLVKLILKPFMQLISIQDE